jgi:hypothetical protein
LGHSDANQIWLAWSLEVPTQVQTAVAARHVPNASSLGTRSLRTRSLRTRSVRGYEIALDLESGLDDGVNGHEVLG